MSDPRIAIVGAGALSSRRIYPYIGAAGAELVGVCDLDREKAERNARRFGGRAYTDYERMLDAERPDGVIICVGPEAHARLAPIVLRKGYPVYTEKPPAPTAAETLEVARVARETGLLCMTGFKKRYSTAYRRARRWLDGFDPSDWYSFSADYCSAQYANDGPRSRFLLDFAIHMIDATAYLMGDAQEVFAFAKGYDAYAVSIRFATGCVGTLNLNCGRSFAIPTEEIEMTVRGANWFTLHNSSQWRIVENGRATEWREPPTFTSAGDSGLDTGHLAELIAFVEALRGGERPPSVIEESYKSMVLYEAIEASAQSGEVVRVVYEPIETESGERRE